MKTFGARHTNRPTLAALRRLSSRIPLGLVIVTIVISLVACAGTPESGERASDSSTGGLVGSYGQRFPEAPEVPSGPLADEANEAMQSIVDGLRLGDIDRDAVAVLGRSGDPRVLWFLNDLMRFSRAADREEIVAAFESLTGTVLPRERNNEVADHLIAWDLSAPPGYREIKRDVLTLIEPRWAPFFDDETSIIDWRLVEWGGVLIDDRLDASPGRRCIRCIPALDDPPVTSAMGGSWYPDDALVFGVVINGEARAYPKNIMQVHEMVNDTLGGRRIAMPYCTLCGAAQVYYTDDVEGFQPVLRTSGLLSRSNKFMYDISTWSAVDTFTGRALSGPLLDAEVRLNQASVVTSTWEEWKEAHPETTIIAGDGGVPGTVYPLDPLRGRDDHGPIFPVGDVDQRLPIQELVLGVRAADGTPVAFPVANAALALRDGESVELRGVRLQLDGGGVRAFIGETDAAAHEAFWFAWSQFNPRTEIWER